MAEISFYGSSDKVLLKFNDFGYEDLKAKVNGDYNKGELLFAGGQLHRINNHVLLKGLNNRKTTDVENDSTRRAVFALIQNEWESSLGADNDVYQEVKRQLIENPADRRKPISRDEVRFMLNLLESEKTRQDTTQKGMDADEAHRQLELSRGLKNCTSAMREFFAKTRSEETMRQFVKGWGSARHDAVNKLSSNVRTDDVSLIDNEAQLEELRRLYNLTDETSESFAIQNHLSLTDQRMVFLRESRASIDKLFGSVFGRAEGSPNGLEEDRAQLLRYKETLGVYGQTISVNGAQYGSESAFVKATVERLKASFLGNLAAGCDAALDVVKNRVQTEPVGTAQDRIVEALDAHIAGTSQIYNHFETVKGKLVGARRTEFSKELQGLGKNEAENLIKEKTKDLSELFANLETSIRDDVPENPDKLEMRKSLFERKSADYKNALMRRATGLLDRLFDGCKSIDDLLLVRESARPFFDLFDTAKAKENVAFDLTDNSHAHGNPLFTGRFDLKTSIQRHSKSRQKWVDLICDRLSSPGGVRELKTNLFTIPDFPTFEALQNSLSEHSDVLLENTRTYRKMFVDANLARFNGFLGSGNLATHGLGTNLASDFRRSFDVDEMLVFGSEYALKKGLGRIAKQKDPFTVSMRNRFTDRLWSAYHALVPRRMNKETGQWLTLRELPAGFSVGRQVEYAKQLMLGTSPTKDNAGQSTEKSWEKVMHAVVENRKKGGATGGAVVGIAEVRSLSDVEEDVHMSNARKDLIRDLKMLLVMVGENPDEEQMEQIEQ